MDPASLGLGVLTSFKEVYLLARFIYKTVASAKNAHAEQGDLLDEFYQQFLFVRSICHVFVVRQNRFIDDESLNEEWMREFGRILEKIRLLFTDYQKLAADVDINYKQYSPYIQDQFFNTRVIEFSNSIEDLPSPSADHTEAKTVLRRLSSDLVAPFRRSAIFHTKPWRWALFDRHHFAKTLRGFQKQNKKLERLLQLNLACNPRYNRREVISEIQEEEADMRVGILGPHIRLRQLALDPQADHTDFHLSHNVITSRSSVALVTSRISDSEVDMMDGNKVWIEYKHYGENEDSVSSRYGNEAQVHQLATLLSTAGRYKLRTLPFKGYIHEEAEHRYAFFFKYPEGAADHRPPVSLLDLLSERGPGLPLPIRFSIASTIAKAFGSFHADGWVHKSIRSASILFFRDDTGSVVFHEPYIGGFEYSRPEAAVTTYTFDSDLESNLYRHPERQGLPSVKFTKTHDIYSLGVVLLEIGLGQTALTMYHNACKGLPPGQILPPPKFQKILQSFAKRNLPYQMGPAYYEAVATCLSAELHSTGPSDAEFTMGFETRVVENLNAKRLRIEF